MHVDRTGLGRCISGIRRYLRWLENPFVKVRPASAAAQEFLIACASEENTGAIALDMVFMQKTL